MIRRCKLWRLALPLTLVLGLTFAAPALADSVAAEQAQGAQVLSQVQHGTLRARSLTADQYQVLGEYLMGRALGSTQLHQRMNTLMGTMMSGYRGSALAGMMGAYLNGRGTPGYPMGPAMMGYGYTANGNSGGGWPTGAIIAVSVLGAVLIGGLAAFALPRIRKRGHSGTAATT